MLPRQQKTMVLVLLGCLWGVTLASAGDAPNQLPYQAQLLDALGSPVTVPTAMRFVILRGGDSSSNPSTGVVVHREDATVTPDAQGVFTHLIGSGTPAGLCDEDGDGTEAEPCALGPEDFADGVTPTFLEIRVDPAGADNILLPRARIGSVGYALRAASVGDLSASQIAAASPPVGAVLPYFGDPADLPASWKVCDGSVVSDPESPLDGVTLPDMRDSFARGETDAARDIPVLGANAGGTDDVPAHTHTSQSAGAHSHSFSVPNHRHPYDDRGYVQSGGSWQAPNTPYTAYAGAHSGTTGSAGSHSHGVNADGGSTGGNVPGYVALHFIIRIK
jgi:hypothetical protein